MRQYCNFGQLDAFAGVGAGGIIIQWGRSSICLPYFELQRPFFQPAWHVELVESGDINREEIQKELTKRQIKKFRYGDHLGMICYWLYH